MEFHRPSKKVEVDVKTRLEAAANIVVIVLAVMLGSVFLKDRFSSPSPEAQAVKAGDKLANPEGWDWGAHDQTLVLGLRKGCQFCEESLPFYQRLITQQQHRGSSPTIVAVFPDTADAVNGLVQSEGLTVQVLAGVPLEKLKISGTPTLLLIDRTGTVVKAWVGILSPRQELEVMKAATAPAAGALKASG